jgi:hypothetical protein
MNDANEAPRSVKAWMKQHVKTVESSMTMAEVETILLENDVGGDVPESSVSLIAVKRQIQRRVRYALNANGREGNRIRERVSVLSRWKQKE